MLFSVFFSFQKVGLVLPRIMGGFGELWIKSYEIYLDIKGFTLLRKLACYLPKRFRSFLSEISYLPLRDLSYASAKAT